MQLAAVHGRSNMLKARWITVADYLPDLLSKIIPDIEEILAAGGENLPKPPVDGVGPAIPNKKGLGDAGHR